MIDIRRVTGDDWELVRDVRLKALLDTPDWFWSTHEEEVSRLEAWWRDRIASGAWFVARDGDRPVGIAAGIHAPETAESDRQLISMWVENEARGRGIGRRLVAAVESWARTDGARRLQLEVTDKNETGRRFYESYGFVATGRTEPLPRKPELIEHEMVLEL